MLSGSGMRSRNQGFQNPDRTRKAREKVPKTIWAHAYLILVLGLVLPKRRVTLQGEKDSVERLEQEKRSAPPSVTEGYITNR